MYRYLAVLEGPDPESAAPLFHTEDRAFIAVVLKLASRHLRRAADGHGRPRRVIRLVPREAPGSRSTPANASGKVGEVGDGRAEG